MFIGQSMMDYDRSSVPGNNHESRGRERMAEWLRRLTCKPKVRTAEVRIPRWTVWSLSVTLARVEQSHEREICRLMTMSPLYPCGKPCSRRTHHETVKNLAVFSSIMNEIMMESRLRISIPWGCFQFFNRIENPITFTP